MASKPGIPVRYDYDPCNESPIITWVTSEPSILYLVWTVLVPTWEQNWRYFRGVRILCGKSAKLWATSCIEQLDPLPSTIHQFKLPTFPPGTRIFYIISDNCSRTSARTWTPPIQFVYPPCPGSAPYCRVRRPTLATVFTDATIPWSQFEAGNIDMWSGNTLTAPTTGNYQLFFDLWVRWDNIIATPCEYDYYFESGAHNPIGPIFHVRLVENQFVYTTQYLTVSLSAAQSIGVRFIRTSGANTIGRIAQTLIPGQYSMNKMS